MSMAQKKKIDEKTPAPSYSEEWKEGWIAFFRNQGKEKNPYIAETDALRYNRWLRGWEAAEYQNAK